MSQVMRVLQLLRDNPGGVCASVFYQSGLPNGRNRVCTLEKWGARIYSAPCWLHNHGEVGEPAYFAYRIEKLPRIPARARHEPKQLALISA